MVSSRRALLCFVALAAGCTAGNPPDLIGLADQVAVVGQQFTLELQGVDPDGDDLLYRYRTDLELGGRAGITMRPSGSGVFRWTPLAADVGAHVFDFSVTDGEHDTTVSIEIDVRASGGGVPVFRQPLGTGRVVDLEATPCIELDVLVEDTDSAQVMIAQEEPLIEGAVLEQDSGQTARWQWCPTRAQLVASNRYTLVLSADDGSSPKVVKNYVLVLDGRPQRLVINEVDYDNTSVDRFEYVEVYNPSSVDVALEGLWVVFIDGANGFEYDAVYLGELERIGPGQHLLIGGPGVDVPAGTLKIDTGWSEERIQNGAPDGIAIIDDVTVTVLDALSYEGAVTNAAILGFPAPVSLVEGTMLPASVADSDTQIRTLCRFPDGVDTDNAVSDWTTCAVRTKAAPNVR